MPIVVQVYGGRTFGWRGAFAVHTWLAAKPAGADRYLRYEVIGWNGIVAVKGTPSAIVTKLNTEVVKILRAPEVKQRLAALGAEPVGNTPDEFGAFIKAEMARWGKIIKEKGIRSE